MLNNSLCLGGHMFLVPVSMVICNDIMAYMFGFFFGRTPLIKLSPKKTWEGFIGGAVSTIVFGIILSYVLIQWDYFVCPVAYDDVKGQLTLDCEKHPVFILTEYNLPATVSIYSMADSHSVSIHSPFNIHVCVCLSDGPFGGFFASGFKRAFKIKDFGDTIPGHGGIMDGLTVSSSRRRCACVPFQFHTSTKSIKNTSKHSISNCGGTVTSVHDVAGEVDITWYTEHYWCRPV
ncbi:hypothetical protein ScPMuIL_004934 [Solemya velum]